MKEHMRRVLYLLVTSLLMLAEPARADIQAIRSQVAELSQLTVQRQAMATAQATQAAAYANKLSTVDRLKKQRSSWRRDRALQEALAQTQTAALALDAAVKALMQRDALIGQKRNLLQNMVDAESAGVALNADVAAELVAVRRQWLRAEPKKLVRPDLTIDPLADPEELDEQARRLALSEQAVRQQIAALDGSIARDARRATLRAQHAKFTADVIGDDGAPSSRTAASRSGDDVRVQTGDAEGTGMTPTAGADGEGLDNGLSETTGPGTATGATEPTAGIPADTAMTAHVVSNLIDAEVARSLASAGDASARSSAAQKARAQLLAELQKISQARSAAEHRAKSLRGGK